MTPFRLVLAVLGFALAGFLFAPSVSQWESRRGPSDGPSAAALTPAHVSGMAPDTLPPPVDPSACTRRVPCGHPKAQEKNEPDLDVTLQVHAESINALGEGLDAQARRLADLAARLVAEEARSAALARDFAALAAQVAAAPEIAPTASPRPGTGPPQPSPEPRATVRARRAAMPAPAAATPCPLSALLAR